MVQRHASRRDDVFVDVFVHLRGPLTKERCWFSHGFPINSEILAMVSPSNPGFANRNCGFHQRNWGKDQQLQRSANTLDMIGQGINETVSFFEVVTHVLPE